MKLKSFVNNQPHLANYVHEVETNRELRELRTGSMGRGGAGVIWRTLRFPVKGTGHEIGIQNWRFRRGTDCRRGKY
jgi:hypothetical protein